MCLSSQLGLFGNPGEMPERVIPLFLMFCYACLICTIVLVKIFCFCSVLHSSDLGHCVSHSNMFRYSGISIEVYDNG